MPFSLLAPIFLAAGAAALAIPVLVHLIHRERSDTIAFPSLMFLRRIPYRSVRRQKIRHWALFLVRCVALVLLAAAFSRPFLRRGDRALTAAAGGRELVILLDQSYSMGYRDRWPRALAAARRAIEGLSPADRASVVLFADEARAVTRPTADQAALRTAVDTAHLSSRGTRYGPALKLARKLLEESPLPRPELVLITDFQKLGWKPDEATRLPEGTALTRVDLSDPRTSDIAVTALSFQREYPQGRERVTVSARLINHGTDPARRVAVALDLNGRELQSRTVDLPPDNAATVAFQPLLLPEGVSRGTVRVAPDALPADNLFHFALAPGQAVRLLIVEPAGSAPDRSLYLRRALAVGDRPAFRAEVKRLPLARADLDGRAAVILDDAGASGGELARLLGEFVSAGGGLVVTLGEHSAAASFAPDAAVWLPAAVGTVVDRPGVAGARLAQIDYGHPIFELFSAPRSGDLSAGKLFRYRRLAPAPAAGEARGAAVLARFDDGSPALVERRVGRGTVLLWASTLDTYWGDLALQPVYLPFVQQVMKHAAGYRERRPWFTVGDAVDLSDSREPVRGELIVVAPSGRRTVLGATSRVLTVTEQGFYEVRQPGAPSDSARVIAVNVDLAESDLTPMDPAELTAAVEPRGSGPGPAAQAARLAPEERERRQAVWWYLLVAAFLLLAGETVLSNRLSRTAART